MNANTEWSVYTDGGARGNPGPAAIGIVIKRDGEAVSRIGKTIGNATNNTAEYEAVIEALSVIPKILHTYGAGETVRFFLDSLLVVQQLRGVFKIKNQHLAELHARVKKLEKALNLPVTYAHIPREQNCEADALVNQALDSRQVV